MLRALVEILEERIRPARFQVTPVRVAARLPRGHGHEASNPNVCEDLRRLLASISHPNGPEVLDEVSASVPSFAWLSSICSITRSMSSRASSNRR